MSRLLVLSTPEINCSLVSLPSRSWSMRRKMSRTRDLLSRSHLLNCEQKKKFIRSIKRQEVTGIIRAHILKKKIYLYSKLFVICLINLPYSSTRWSQTSPRLVSAKGKKLNICYKKRRNNKFNIENCVPTYSGRLRKCHNSWIKRKKSGEKAAIHCEL